MRAGELRCYVYIKRRPSTQTGFGDQTSWASATLVLEGWADIEALSGGELMSAAAVQNKATHRITMRQADGVLPGDRLEYGARIFNIVSPPRDRHERHRKMQFEAEEGLNNG